MLQTLKVGRGAVVASHHLASQAGLRVLQDGGNAIEAMIAAASTVATVYPHMNGLGGDNFWLIATPGSDVVGIDACGGAATRAEIISNTPGAINISSDFSRSRSDGLSVMLFPSHAGLGAVCF